MSAQLGDWTTHVQEHGWSDGLTQAWGMGHEGGF